jgi:hypothetical protein
MSVSGSWTLHWNFGCGNSYNQTALTFNNNGTFSGQFPGRWAQREGTMLLSFDSGPVKYGGTIDGNVGSGASTDWAGTNGCWYLIQQGVAGLAEAAAPEQAADPGNAS